MVLAAVFILLVFAFSLVSGRLEKTILTAPMFFTAGGIAIGFGVEAFQPEAGSRSLLLAAAELGLVLLLFTDASRTPLRGLGREGAIPLRLLALGMPLTLLLGAFLALLVLPGIAIWEAAILAAILAPTDAGLGQVIVKSPLLPEKLREALNVEAGLNDGLSVPFLLFFLAMAGTAAVAGDPSLKDFLVEQLGYGTLIGVAIGLPGGWFLGKASSRQWIAGEWFQLGVVALPVLCLLFAGVAGASMFIAAFVAGLAVQVCFREAGKHSVEFTEEWGQLVNLSVFFLFGIIVARSYPMVEWPHVLYAVLSLTVIRMLPVAFALLGTGLSRASITFIGWFGPRGLASIVLGLVFLEHLAENELVLPARETIVSVVVCTVLMSIFAHGSTATAGSAWLARKLRNLPPGSPDLDPESTPN